MYCIRNKRGMIHKNHIDPNQMDAYLILNNSKRVLAELIRLSSSLSFDKTIEIVDSIMYRETSIIWNAGNFSRILDTRMSCADQIVCLLYLKNNQTEQELRKTIEYSNASRFKDILKALHKNRLIEYSDSICIISPIGIQKSRRIIKVMSLQHKGATSCRPLNLGATNFI